MKQHLAIIGFGRLGRACAQAILQDERFALAGIVRRPEHALEPPFAQSPVVSHISELGRVDAALICVPTAQLKGLPVVITPRPV